MHVICGRCETEYEFDDALVSERGTTVKCTNCGLQFRVQPARAGKRVAPERWLIRQASGAEVVFTSLGELQRAIAAHTVHISDSLSKDGQHFRPMREVAELIPFFRRASQAPAAIAATAKSTLLGISESQTAPEKAPLEGTLMSAKEPRRAAEAPPQVAVEQLASRVIESPRRSEPPPKMRRTPLGGLGPAENPIDLHIPPSSRVPDFASGEEFADTSEAPSLAPNTEMDPALEAVAATAAPPSSDQPTLDALERPSTPRPAVAEADGPGLERRGRRPAPDEFASTQVSRSSVPPRAGDSEPPSSRRNPKSVIPAPIVAPPPRRRSGGMRWVAAIVLLGAAVLAITTVGRGYLSQFVSTESEVEKDERVDALLSSGERHIVAGDLEAAKAEFDKASVLSENHTGALLGLARIEAVRADRVWLKQYLLPADATTARAAASNEMGVRVSKLGAALSAAKRVAPDDPRTVQLAIDFERVQGNIGSARAIIGKLTTDATDPHTAYVLAALDVAEAEPVWSTVLQRLNSAMAADRGLGRAQALLIIALAESRDIKAAERELARLRAQATPHPLAELLSAFVKRSAAEAAAEPDPEPSAPPPAPPESAGAKPAGVGDFRAALEQAAAARRNGQLIKSEELFERALKLQPGNAEATAGLGDIARRRGQLGRARRHFQTVLSRNPDYMPAVVGMADLKWAAGERQSALALYERIVPGTPYYERAQRRIKQSQAAPPTINDSPPWPGDKAEPAKPAQPKTKDDPPAIKSTDPYIDTSDLPGF